MKKCHGTLQGRGLLKSHRLSETPIVWRNTSDTFTPRGLGYNCSSCELVKCFELKESDGNCIVSVSADNLLVYNLVLVSLYLVAKVERV